MVYVGISATMSLLSLDVAAIGEKRKRIEKRVVREKKASVRLREWLTF